MAEVAFRLDHSVVVIQVRVSTAALAQILGRLGLELMPVWVLKLLPTPDMAHMEVDMALHRDTVRLDIQVDTG